MNPPGSLLNLLPGVYHSSDDLRKLLGALETILFKPDEQALESEIAGIARLFSAIDTPAEFLPWLAQWVALSHSMGLTEEQQRQLVGNIVPLYAWRGTRRYLVELLQYYLPKDADIQVEDQRFNGLVIGIARVGMDSWLERDRPFWFKVTIRLPRVRPGVEHDAQWRHEWQERIRQVIELAKPAYTTFDLDCAFGEMNA